MSSRDFMRVKNVIDQVRDLKKGKNFSRALEILERSLEEYPGNNFLQASLADLHLRQNDPNKAESLADEILDRDPGDFRALTVKGDVFYYRRDYQQALEFFENALAQREEGFLAGKLVKTYHRLEKFSEALSICQRFLEKNPEDNYIKKLRAQTYEKMGKEDQARKDYGEYLEKEGGEDHFAYKENIKLKLKGKPPETRVKELSNLIKFSQGEKKFHLCNLLGKELEGQKKYDEAIEQYKKALEIEPGDPFVLKQAGFCLYRGGREAEALFYLEEAFKSDPEDFYTRSALLAAYKKTGEIERGIEFFKQIIQKDSSQKKLWGVIRKLSKEEEEGNDEENR